MNFNKVVQFLALGLILIVLPVGSLLYLRNGWFERYNALQELKDLGEMPAFEAQTQSGKMIANKQLKGRYVVLGKMDTFDESSAIIDQSKKLFEQFGNSKEIALCTYVDQYDSLAINTFTDAIVQDTTSKWYFLHGDKDILSIFDTIPTGHLALIDTSLTVRHFYDTASDDEIGLMAKHIAMFVAPLKRRAELEFRREKEK